MRKIFLIIICLISLISKGQEVYLKVPLGEIKKSSNFIENVHLTKQKDSKIISLFVEESKITYGFQFDKDLNQIAQLTSSGLKRKFKEIIGQVNDGDRVRIIQKNQNGNKFASILYDFKNKKTEEIEYDLDLSNQKYLQSYSKGESSYIFSIFKYTNILRKWTFDINGNVSFEDINLDSEIAQKSNENLYNLIKENIGLTASYLKVFKIENRLPNVLGNVTAGSKMFPYNEGFYWTLDKNNHYTLLLDFQLPDLQPKIRVIEKPKMLNLFGATSNSYIVDNIIGQIISNNREMHIVFKDLKSLNIINEYSLDKDDTIDFKNGPILQEGAVYSFGKTRKLEKASKYLRKISSFRNGLSILKTNEGYKTVIGGIRKPSSGGGFGAASGFGGLPVGAIGGAALSFNPASLAYGSYGSTASTRIESLFDTNFIHKNGEILPDVLDDINLFSEKWLKEGDNVYILDDFVLFGNYQASKKTFGLYKFEHK